ncbi:2Fe-2S iron-sulfur cluster-binding protein [Streptomyces xiamenensis]
MAPGAGDTAGRGPQPGVENGSAPDAGWQQHGQHGQDGQNGAPHAGARDGDAATDRGPVPGQPGTGGGAWAGPESPGAPSAETVSSPGEPGPGAAGPADAARPEAEAIPVPAASVAASGAAGPERGHPHAPTAPASSPPEPARVDVAAGPDAEAASGAIGAGPDAPGAAVHATPGGDAPAVPAVPAAPAVPEASTGAHPPAPEGSAAPQPDGPAAGPTAPDPGPDAHLTTPPPPAAEGGPVQRPATFGGSAGGDESGSWVIPSEVTDPTHGESEPAPPPPPTDSEHPETSYVLRVNGIDRAVSSAWIGESLLYVLRERLGLAGAKDGCSQGECGACSVQVDGRLVAACLVPAATAAGCEIRTVEGLGTEEEPSDVQRALSSCAVQCGFCLPGMAMTVHDLLEGNHQPTELQTRQALCGNLCRCSGYRGVLDAVRTVIDERAERAERAEHTERAARTAAEPPRIPQQSGPSEGDA